MILNLQRQTAARYPPESSSSLSGVMILRRLGLSPLGLVFRTRFLEGVVSFFAGPALSAVWMAQYRLTSGHKVNEATVVFTTENWERAEVGEWVGGGGGGGGGGKHVIQIWRPDRTWYNRDGSIKTRHGIALQENLWKMGGGGGGGSGSTPLLPENISSPKDQNLFNLRLSFFNKKKKKSNKDI